MVSPESAELCIRSDRAGLFDNVLCVFLQPGLRVLGMYSMLDEHAQDRYLSSKILLASQIAAFKIGAPRVARFFFTRRERLHCALPKGCPLDCWPYWYQPNGSYQDPAQCHAGSYVAEAAPFSGATTY
ncbi:uncharacterized protein [Lolium perenne]|uniref:uncharacterized protein isoform X2 n=1 Tax=Lolium perenne TaxID=4522 RepID=UPI003A9A4323